MKTVARCLALALLILIPRPAAAHGLVSRLPEDGTWVRYHLTVQIAEQNAELSGKLTLSSVGSATERDEACRWIEIQLDLEQSDGTAIAYVIKALIPEKHLKQGGNPLDHVVRAWQKQGEEEVKAIDAAASPSAGPLPIFLPGLLTEPGKLDEPRVVDYQRGQLKCPEGTQGTRKFHDDNLTSVVEYALWPHADVPFGTAAARMKLRIGANNSDEAPRLVATIELSLDDLGSDAKTGLPDNQ